MAKAEITETIPVSKEKLFSVITKYENYPQFVEGVSSTKVERISANEAKVTYVVSIMKEIEYTLTLKEDLAAGTVQWSLLKGDAFKVNEGKWTLKEVDSGKTQATYAVDVEFKIPVPGFVLNRLVKGSLPSMMKNFAERAKKA